MSLPSDRPGCNQMPRALARQACRSTTPILRRSSHNSARSKGGKSVPVRVARCVTIPSGNSFWAAPLFRYAVTPRRQISNFSNDKIQNFEYSPDGKQLWMLRLHVESDVVILRDAGSTTE